jgi:hypothetical protein
MLMSGVNACRCWENPEKVYSTSGCYLCWTCKRCGESGGCDNLVNNYTAYVIPNVQKLPDRTVILFDERTPLLKGGDTFTLRLTPLAADPDDDVRPDHVV